MPTFGLSATGFLAKTTQIVRDEINQVYFDTFGSSLNLTDATPLGKEIGIQAERIGLLWELAEAAYAAGDPDRAEAAALEAVCALTGTIRKIALSSTVTLTATGTASTVITVGSQASVTGTDEVFVTLAAGTLALLTIWVATTAYVVGDRRSNGGNSYICTVAGTSAGSGGPTGETDAEVDNTVTWRFLGNGVSAADIAASSLNTGPILAVAFGIITIETPISGWDSVINLLDAVPGTDIEEDGPLRLRREDEIAAAGAGTIDAVRAALLQVSGVTSVTNFWNNKILTDANGVPPKAVECLIQGGADQDIWDALLANVGGGIETHGDEIGTATDSEGNDFIMAFSRPTEIDIHVEMTLTFDVITYPTDGDAQIKAAIVAFGLLQATGKDAVSGSIEAQAFTVLGVSEASLTAIGLSTSPTLETTIAIGSRELAVHDTSRIVINSSAATP